MAQVHIVTGEHWNVPGNRMAAFSNIGSATAEAVHMVEIMAKDSGLGVRVTLNNWESVLATLQDKHGAQYCDVSITTLELLP